MSQCVWLVQSIKKVYYRLAGITIYLSLGYIYHFRIQTEVRRLININDDAEDNRPIMNSVPSMNNHSFFTLQYY